MKESKKQSKLKTMIQEGTKIRVILLFVWFISTNNYKNKAIQRRGVEANGAIALQPVEGPGPVCQQTAKGNKENIFTANQVGVTSEHTLSPAPTH